MRRNIRTLGAVVIALALVAGSGQVASAAFSKEILDCRGAIEKAASKLSKTILKSLTGCAKSRAKDGTMSGTNCNSIAAADTKGTVAKAEQKLTDVGVSGGKCFGLTPSSALYEVCPAPCAGAIADFSDVTDCIICLARANAEAFSDATNGTPASPLGKDDSKCQTGIGSNGAKVYNTVLTDVTKCQSTAEKGGIETSDGCADTNFPSQKVTDTATKAYDKIASGCSAAVFTNLDSCDTTQLAVANCVKQEALDSAQELVGQILQLPSTTTTTTTTTTTLPASNALCPDLGQVVLYSKDSTIACTSNTDCAQPRTCDTALGHCVTVSTLDSGWTGLSHKSDVDDSVLTQAKLSCVGPPSPGCGVCTVVGVDPGPGNCRCSNNTRTICDKPFAADAVNCAGATCDCYFGAPMPLAAAGTPACVVNRFKQDITGTANVDLGAGQVSAKLSTRVYLGITTVEPCPYCNGDPTPGDGVRVGVCVEGANAGLTCDADAINTSFPVAYGPYTPPGGTNVQYSLDCMPATGKNVSGAGLNINLNQSTGTSSLAFGVDCDGVAGGPQCPCRQCSGSSTNMQVPCTGDSDCTPLGGSCTVSGGSFACLSNSDCSSLNYGTCNIIHRCTLASGVACTTNADCLNKNGAPCNVSTCTTDGVGRPVQPNGCTLGDTCVDLDGGLHGECSSGPDNSFCDGAVRADGTGVLSCTTNADCATEIVGGPAGNCSLVVRRPCFLDPIVAVGQADPNFPIGAATFCIPPTSSDGINATSGLPGPGRTINQLASATFCKNNHAIQYTPGGVPACP